MKKKVITALLITMTLTLGTVGTVFAMDNDVASGETGNDVNMIKEGFIWVVDKEAWTETIEHEAVYEDKYVVDKEAWTETINHPAEYKDVWVVDKEAWTETVNHPEEGHYETVVIKPAWDETVEKIKYVCRCGAEFGNVAAWKEHDQHFVEQGDFSHGGYSNVPYHEVINHPAVTEDKWVVDKEAWTETINHPEEGHTEKELVKEAWTETVNHPEEGHWEKELVKEAWDELIKEAWDEVVHHEEEGHFEWVVDQEGTTDIIEHPAKTHEEWVVDKKAWTEVIKHDAEYEKVWVVDKEAWTEKIKHDAEGHWELVKTTTKPVTTPEKTEEKGSLQNDNKDADQIPKTGDMTSFSSLIALAGSTLIATGATYKLRKKSKK